MSEYSCKDWHSITVSHYFSSFLKSSGSSVAFLLPWLISILFELGPEAQGWAEESGTVLRVSLLLDK